MSEFVLIDLEKQGSEFLNFMEGKAIHEILEWLQYHGTLIAPESDYGYYEFESVFHIRSVFDTRPDGEFRIYGGTVHIISHAKYFKLELFSSKNEQG